MLTCINYYGLTAAGWVAYPARKLLTALMSFCCVVCICIKAELTFSTGYYITVFFASSLLFYSVCPICLRAPRLF